MKIRSSSKVGGGGSCGYYSDCLVSVWFCSSFPYLNANAET
jgi:hypothetical protein